jgi:hypothetical protein
VPRLVLVDDDGREMFSGQVSRANVERTAAFLRRNLGSLQVIANARRAVSLVVDGLGQLGAIALPPPPPPKRRARR